MAFQSVEEFNDERYHDMFRLTGDKDSAEVIFLYRSKKDELKVTAHYIKTNTYSGYVHCCGEDCPACARHFRLDTKLFVPMYVLKHTDRLHGERKIDKIEFWDKKVTFDKQLNQDVFYNYASPVEYVFRITRNGEASDRGTRYEIRAIAKNTMISYDDILAKFNAEFPDYYSTIIKEFSVAELSDMLKNTNAPYGSSSAGADLPEYTPTPRAGYQSTGYQPSIPDTYVSATDAVGNNFVGPSDDMLSDDEFPEPDF